MIRSKTCFKCKVVKPIDDFYVHSQMLDGHLNKCKECAKKDSTTNRVKNLERIREYDRNRNKNKNRKEKAAELIKLWRQEDARRSKAHNAVARALKSGVLTKLPCERCGNTKSVAHHEDYDHLLQVVWLCQPCHKQRHKEIFQGIKHEQL